jgi:predicted nucleotide-binding protein
MVKRTRSAPLPGTPQVPPSIAITLLREQISKGQLLLAARPLSSDNYSKWELISRNYLEKAFGVDSPNVSSILDVGSYGAFPLSADETWWEHHRAESLKTQLTKMEGLVELLNTEIGLLEPMSAETTPPRFGHKVFLVHGHDEKTFLETARFLEKLQQHTIILREQPNMGRTIIEKFEDYADVGFAVVLLTADDQGGIIGDPYETQHARARQNVILELGYFLGRLGRNRVCALYRSNVEIPSDYSGVLYVPLDEAGAWRFSLAKEMKAAGLDVDMNLAV